MISIWRQLIAYFLVVIAAFVLIAGCGQKGPLYLPDQAPEIVEEEDEDEEEALDATDTQPQTEGIEATPGGQGMPEQGMKQDI